MRRLVQLRSLWGWGRVRRHSVWRPSGCGPGDFTALLEDLQVAVDAFMYDVLAGHR
jgi:hypothetical protein